MRIKRVGAFVLRSVHIVLIAGVILSFFAQAWMLGLILLLLEWMIASSVRVQRATREVRLGIFDLFTRCIRITRFGVVFLALALFMGVAALNTGANLLYLMFGVLSAMVLVSGVASTVALSRLRFRRILPDDVYAGDEFVVRLEVRNPKRVFSAMGLLVRDSPEHLGEDAPSKAFLMKIGPGASGVARYVARVDRRGRFTFDHLAVSTCFPFGIVEIRFDIPLVDEIVVLPRIGQLADTVVLEGERRDEDAPRLSFLRGVEEDFKGLREFRQGDNPRHIHWRTSARLGELVVKEFDRQEERSVCVFLDTFIGKRELDERLSETIERAISFTATILSELARQEYEVYLATHAPEFFVSAGGGESRRLVSLLQVLATLEPSREHDLSDLFREARQHVPQMSKAVLVRITETSRRNSVERLSPNNGYMKVFVAETPAFENVFILSPEGRRYAGGRVAPSVIVA